MTMSVEWLMKRTRRTDRPRVGWNAKKKKHGAGGWPQLLSPMCQCCSRRIGRAARSQGVFSWAEGVGGWGRMVLHSA